MIIDVHGHLVPPDLLAAIRKEHGRFASLRLVEDGGSLAIAFAGGKPSRPIMKGLSDVAGRLAWMDKQGIDRHVVGGWPDWFGYELPAAEGEAWCRLFNDAQLAAAKAEPRFVPLASVPLQDGARAAAVLKAAVAAGFPGAMISTLPRGIGSVLDAADLDPFWAAADETGAVIHIHPSYDAGDTRVNDYGLANGVGRISDAIVAVARLLCSGHVTRYRNARIFVPMGAAGLALPPRAPQAQPQDHARDRRSGGGTCAALYRQHSARPAGAAICRGDHRRRPCDDGLGHAVPDRRRGACQDRRQRRTETGAGRLDQRRACRQVVSARIDL